MPVDSGTWKRLLITAAPLVVLFVLALAVRVHDLQSHPVTRSRGMGPFGDTLLYHSIAYNLYAGRGYSGTLASDAFGLGEIQMPEVFEPAISRGPLYPAFLSLAYRWIGSHNAMKSPNTWANNWTRVRHLQSVIDAMLVIAVYWLVRLIAPTRGRWVGLLAAAAYAVCPYNVYYTSALLSETVSTTVFTWSLALMLAALRRNRVALILVSGAGLGLFALGRQEFLPWVLAIPAGIYFLARGRRRRRALMAGALALGALCTIGPWTARNAVVFDSFIPIATGPVGYSLFLGTFEGSTEWDGWEQYPDHIFSSAEEREEVQRATRALTGALGHGGIGIRTHDALFRQRALDVIRRDFPGIVWTWLRNAPRLWYFDYVKMYPRAEARPFFMAIVLLLCLTAAIRSTPGERGRLAVVFSVAVYATLIFLPLHIEPRYCVPLIPSLIACAGVGLACGIAPLRSALPRWMHAPPGPASATNFPTGDASKLSTPKRCSALGARGAQQGS